MATLVTPDAYTMGMRVASALDPANEGSVVGLTDTTVSVRFDHGGTHSGPIAHRAWREVVADVVPAPAPAVDYPDTTAAGVAVPLDTPIGSPVRARGVIGAVQGTLVGWARSTAGMRPIVAYTKHGRDYRSHVFDTVTPAR